MGQEDIEREFQPGRLSALLRMVKSRQLRGLLKSQARIIDGIYQPEPVNSAQVFSGHGLDDFTDLRKGITRKLPAGVVLYFDRHLYFELL